MVIDCDECVMQYTNACEDCFVTVVLGVTLGGETLSGATPNRLPAGRAGAGSKVELDDEEAAAVENLAELGLVPKLRLVPRQYCSTNGDQSDDVATG